jgi:hypothetical protein
MNEIVQIIAGIVNGISRMKTSRIVLLWCVALSLVAVWQAANIITAITLLSK